MWAMWHDVRTRGKEPAYLGLPPKVRGESASRVNIDIDAIDKPRSMFISHA